MKEQNSLPTSMGRANSINLLDNYQLLSQSVKTPVVLGDSEAQLEQ